MLVFIINNRNDISFSVENELVDLYYNYYKSTNGMDLFDSFLEISNMDKKHYKNKLDVIEEYANNYSLSNKVLDNEYKYILIYNNNTLIGCSRFIIDNKDLKVLDIIINEDNYEEVLSFIEEYAKKKKINNIYIEIPSTLSIYLIKANKMGFIEEDVIKDNAYIVCKRIKEKNE